MSHQYLVVAEPTASGVAVGSRPNWSFASFVIQMADYFSSISGTNVSFDKKERENKICPGLNNATLAVGDYVLGGGTIKKSTWANWNTMNRLLQSVKIHHTAVCEDNHILTMLPLNKSLVK